MGIMSVCDSFILLLSQLVGWTTALLEAKPSCGKTPTTEFQVVIENMLDEDVMHENAHDGVLSVEEIHRCIG